MVFSTSCGCLSFRVLLFLRTCELFEMKTQTTAEQGYASLIGAQLNYPNGLIQGPGPSDLWNDINLDVYLTYRPTCFHMKTVLNSDTWSNMSSDPQIEECFDICLTWRLTYVLTCVLACSSIKYGDVDFKILAYALITFSLRLLLWLLLSPKAWHMFVQVLFSSLLRWKDFQRLYVF